MTLSLCLSTFCQPAQRSRRTKPSKFKAIQSSWSNGNVLDILFDFNPKPQGPQKVVSANECNCFMIFMLRATRNPCTVDRLIHSNNICTMENSCRPIGCAEAPRLHIQYTVKYSYDSSTKETRAWEDIGCLVMN